VRFKKGRVLNADDVAALQKAGISEVIAARLEDGDVHEDEAAARIAAAVCGEGLRPAAAFTGRCNLVAECDGLVVFDRDSLDALNLIDESVTIATLDLHEPVQAGQLVATIKIIPFSTPESIVDTWEQVAADNAPMLRIAAYRPFTAGLVLTRVDGMKESILDKTVDTVRTRVEALGGTLGPVIRCDHRQTPIAEAVTSLKDQGGSPVLVFGASAIVDRRDVVPAGIEQAGGTVDHFGMPVDPGNLLLLGHHGDDPVIGVPGCARSPKLNGFDWVLRRLTAGIPVTRDDIMRMGGGGLLKEIVSRPQPRERPETVAPREPRVAALILAAGQSRRMGPVNKLLAEIDGVPMVRRVAEAVAASRVRRLVVVTGHEQDRVEQALAGLDVDFVHNPDYADGLSTSLRTGIRHLMGAQDDPVDGAVVCLGDMPRISAALVDKLIAAFNPVEGRGICVPTYDGKRGNPVLWPADLFLAMTKVSGDVGARAVIGENEELVCEIAVDDDAVLLDIDTVEALRDYEKAVS
jgi:molybdenum cofactor cytidylyltransferase